MSTRSSDPAFLFDLDGTLVDTTYEHVLAWSVALRSDGMIAPNWKIHRRIGMSGKALIRQLMRDLRQERNKLKLETLEEKHDAEFARIAKTIHPLAGAQDLLDRLTRLRVRWGIATTGSKKQTNELLRKLRIPARTVVITGDDVTKAKPSPDVFVTASKRLNMRIEDCIVVGDSIWDMLAAGRRRALAVGVLSGGYSKEELEESGAFRVYDDPGDLLQHLEDLGID